MPPAHSATRPSAWARLVVLSAVVLGVAAAGALIWSLAAGEERTTTYTVGGMLQGVALDLGDADVDIEGAGAGTTVTVRHVDRFGFGHDAQPVRSVEGGVFRIRSRCPRTVLHPCTIRYRLDVPDNLPLRVRTTGGHVRMHGYRGSASIATGSGAIDVEEYCGFSLQARSASGDLTADTLCPPQELALRTTTGDIHALVPPGRYRVSASTAGGRPVVRGITPAPDAPFTLQALSSSGDVVVERRP